MSCQSYTIKGRGNVCKLGLSGVKKIGFAPYIPTQKLSLDANGYYEGVGLTFSGSIYEFLTVTDANIFEPKLNKTNSSKYYTQTLTVDLPIFDKETGDVLDKMSNGFYYVFVTDNNDKIRLIGELKGAEIIDMSATTGGAYGDETGYKVTIEATSSNFAWYLGTTGSSVYDSMVDNTDVIIPSA